MSSNDSNKSYRDHVAALKRRFASDSAVRAAIGGEFGAIGALEHQLLKSVGLKDGQYLIDIGCGSGRLAYQLKNYGRLRYLGTDVVPDLIDHATRITERSDWKFAVTEGFSIPATSGEADFVCFFSVFTHLLHEQSYRYLQEAARVLKPGGCAVFSFLEFRIPCHWEQFQHSVRHPNANQHLNQFVDRDAIAAWAQHLGFAVESIADGDRPHIPLDDEVEFEDGKKMVGVGNLGQSVAVLRKPRTEAKPLEKAASEDASIGALLSENGAVIATPAWTPAPTTMGRFLCMSARGYVGTGHSVLIVGFVIADSEERVLVRAISSALIRHGLTDVLERPQLRIHDRTGKVIAENSGSSTHPPEVRAEIAAVIKRIGAERIDPAGTDAALLLRLPPGDYTAMICGRDGGTGLVVGEICEVPNVS